MESVGIEPTDLLITSLHLSRVLHYRPAHFPKSLLYSQHITVSTRIWWQRLDSNQPHTDFQSAALPDELRRHWYPVKVTILGLTIISRVLYL